MKSILIIFISFIFSKIAMCQDIKQMIKAKPITITGALSVRNVYITGGKPLTGGNSNSILLNGNTTISLYGFDIPLSFNISPQGQTYQQPFNQYGASPTYKWVTVHLGHRNLNYNPYTLAGHTMLGAGFDIAPKKFRFGIMRGRLSAATKIDTVNQSLQPVSFSRKGTAGHIGYEGKKNRLDLSVIVAEDDSSSVNFNLANASARNRRDITPAGNVAMGLALKLQLTKQLYFDGNYGLSIYTRDVRNPSLLTNVVPDGDVRIITKKLLQVNQSTEYYNAIQALVGYNEKLFSLKFRYIRIAPDFKTMGAYFINSDVQSFTIMPAFSVWKRKINISSSIGFQNDNLNKNKRTTSKRVIGSTAINALLSKQLMVNANYSNYNINQVANVLRIADTFRITQATQNINITPIYTQSNAKRTNSYMANINLNTLNDFNTAYAINAQSRTLNTLAALISFRRNIIAKKLGYTVGINFNNVSGNTLNYKNVGGNIGLDKAFYNNKINVGFTNTVLVGKRNSSTTLIVSSGLQANAQMNKRHSFNLGAFLNSTQLKSLGIINNINYFRGELAYTLNF